MVPHEAFRWEDEFAVHSEEIQDHRESLDSLVDDLRLLAGTQPEDASAAAERLAALLHYTRLHFAIEEQFMRRHAYLRREQHAGEHDVLLDGMQALKSQLDGNEVELVPELVDCLAEALNDHLAGEERLYEEFVLSASPA